MKLGRLSKIFITILAAVCLSGVNPAFSMPEEAGLPKEEIIQEENSSPYITVSEDLITEDIEKIEPEGKALTARAVMVDLSSDTLEYNQDDNTFTATGSAKVIIEEYDSELIAEKIIYNQAENSIRAIGNVKIIREGQEIDGSFVNLDLDKRSALIDDPTTVVSQIRMSAKQAIFNTDLIDLSEGTAYIEEEDVNLSAYSSVYRPQELRPDLPGFGPVQLKEEQKPPQSSFKIVADEIILDRSKTAKNLVIKGASIKVGNKKLVKIPQVAFTVGGGEQVVEAMLPTIGYDRVIGGLYLGPSITLDLPRDSYLRVSPVVSAFGSEATIGGGGVGKFRSNSNETDIAYLSTGDKLFLRGEQRLYKENTKIEYYMNEYPQDGFIGRGFYRPEYLVELVDERRLGSVLNHSIYSRASTGLAKDANDGVSTVRYQLQGNIISDNPLVNIKDIIQLRLQSQFNLSAYGTGQTYSVVRGGPRVDMDLGRLSLTTAYMYAGVWGNTPFLFDQYIRGTNNLIVAGDFELSRYISVGNISSLNLSQDGVEPRFATENQIYARIGPDDFKIRVGYDIVRKRSIFGLDLFLGSGRSALEFDKLKVLHPTLDKE